MREQLAGRLPQAWLPSSLSRVRPGGCAGPHTTPGTIWSCEVGASEGGQKAALLLSDGPASPALRIHSFCRNTRHHAELGSGLK